MSENIFNLRVNFYSVFTASFFYYLDTSKRFDCAAQHFVSLQADNDFIFLINISRCERSDGWYCGRIERAYTIVCTFFSQSFQTFVPNNFCTFSWTDQEWSVALVRRNVCLYEIGDVDFMVPTAFFKIHCHKFEILKSYVNVVL